MRIVGARSARLALSFYPGDERHNFFVSPPILRRKLFDLQPDPDGKHLPRERALEQLGSGLPESLGRVGCFGQGL